MIYQGSPSIYGESASDQQKKVKAIGPVGPVRGLTIHMVRVTSASSWGQISRVLTLDQAPHPISKLKGKM